MAKLSLLCVILFLCVSGFNAESKTKIPEQKQDFFTGGDSLQHNEATKEKEQARFRRSDDLGSVEAVLATHAQELSQLKAQLQVAENKLQAAGNIGSTYVRWGRTQCPSNTDMVYTGVAGGKYKDEQGSGPNRLCLPLTPEFDNTAVPTYHARLFGAEYYQVSGHHYDDVPCSLCRVALSTTIIVPATRTCPPGWTSQYTGHLMGAYYSTDYAVEYVCLDDQPENRPSGDAHANSNYFMYTVTVCGSLPCPPFENNKVVTCVVCSN